MKKKDYIKFNGYEIIKIGAEKILIDDNFREKSDNEIEHFYNILPLKDNFSEIETYQGIKFSGSHSLPYNIEIVLKGNFSIFIENKEEIENMIRFNIPAIQYPFLILPIVLFYLTQFQLKQHLLIHIVYLGTIFLGFSFRDDAPHRALNDRETQIL